MQTSQSLLIDLKNKKYKPIYFLTGDEPYFIDEIANFIAENVLDEAEKSFNQLIMYGKETTVDEIVSQAKRYPMMSDYQVVIVREAQELSRNIESLLAYAENPMPSTLLVLLYKYKTLDKRKKLYKTIQKNGVLFESKRLYENQVGTWIQSFLHQKGYEITPKATAMLIEFLGTELTLVANELNKLFLSVTDEKKISPEIIESHIGLSKDFNNFELRKAIGERNYKKAAQIVRYFIQSPKEHPIVVSVGLLFSFFSQLLQYHGLEDKSAKQVAAVLKINPYFVSEYQLASKNYTMKQASHVISVLRDIDLKSKGLGAGQVSQEELFKELLARIII
ncbi:MAG: DNA polymerase III subunit delta [Flavobacteriaceae bacterium]|nr:DNA polymerase III subunit delta [Flavobacteriaceae bacterium]